MSSLGLNDHHQAAIVNYLRFARYQKNLRLKSVKRSFEDVRTSQLTDDTFTLDEVSDILNGLLSVIMGEVDEELGHAAHTNTLLLMQVFQQAEKWHLKLQADISELENRELLEQIKDFEEHEFAGATRDSDFRHTLRLQPLNESGGTALLNMEIERMNEENEKLKERLKHVESQALTVQKEKSALQAQIDRLKMDSSASKNRSPERSGDEVDELRRQVSGLKTSLDKTSSMTRAEREQMERDLSGTKHELLRIQEMLELAEKELEKKVSQTAPFKNLKQMLQKKNEQMKDLRKRLSKYEKVDD